MPVDRCFEIILPNRAAPEVVAGEPGRRTTCFAEIPLGISGPRTRVDGVTQLLVGQFLAGDVDRLEPVQLFAVCPRAEIDHKLVIEYLLLLIVLEIVKRQSFDGEIAVDVLTD